MGELVQWSLEKEGAGEEDRGALEVAQLVGGQLLVDPPGNVDLKVDVVVRAAQKVKFRHALLNLLSLLRFHQYKIIRS